MLEAIDSLSHNPVIVVLVVLVLAALVSLLRKGKISEIGKNGVKFTTGEFNSIQAQLTQLSDQLKEHKNIDDKRYNETQKALLRLQILSTETTLETKLNLYDTYKSIGGNSYIDKYIKEICYDKGGIYGKGTENYSENN